MYMSKVRLVDREPCDDEDIFGGIIVESWRGLRRRPQQEKGSSGFLWTCCGILFYLNMAPNTQRLLGGSRPVFRAPSALSLGINHGLKYKFIKKAFLKLVCYLMVKKWAETRRISELVDGVEA